MEDRWFCDLEPSERWPHYTRANAGEVLAPPASPLGQTFVWDNGTFLGLSWPVWGSGRRGDQLSILLPHHASISIRGPLQTASL